MSSYLENINCMLRDTPKKITVRREHVSELSYLFNIDDVKDAISKNTNFNNLKELDKVTWHRIFLKVHQMIKDETTGQFAKGSDKSKRELQDLYRTLLLKVVCCASTPSAVHLDSNTLIASLFEFLDDGLYKNLHLSYMAIFKNFVLRIRLYRVAMKLCHWKKLLKLAIKLYKSEEMAKNDMLEIMQKIVQHCHFQLQMLDDIKALLPFLMNLFQDIANSPKEIANHSNNAFKLAYTVCKLIAPECRRTLCEFSEQVLPRMITLPDDSDKNKLFLLFVILHHPNGVISTDETAYAHDWATWKRIVISMYINMLNNEKNKLFSANLAAAVIQQLIEDASYRTEELMTTNSEPIHRAKRQRLTIDIKKPIELFDLEFVNVHLENQRVIIQVLTVLMNKYPTTLNLADLPSLMEVIVKLFNEHIQNEKITDSLCVLCKILVKTENILSNSMMPIVTTKKYWDKIWHVLVKILSMGQCEKNAHQLLELLIQHIGVTSVNAILCLYMTNEIKWSLSSLRTLLIFCQSVSNIPEYIEENAIKQEETVKIRLLRWLLNVSLKGMTSTTVKTMCEILTGLTLKTWHQNHPISPQITENLTSRECEWKTLDEITKYNLSLEFKTDLFCENHCADDENVGKKLLKPLFDDEILNFVIKHLSTSICNEKISTENIDKLIFNLTIVATFLNNLLMINLLSDDSRLGMLLNKFQLSFHKSNEFLIKQQLLDRSSVGIVALIKALTILYENKYHTVITNIIVDPSTKGILQDILMLMNVVNESDPSEEQGLGISYYEDIFELRERNRAHQRILDNKVSFHNAQIPEDSVITIGAHCVITSFCCLDTGNEITELQARCLRKILQVEVYAPNITGNLWQSLVFMKKVVACRHGFFPAEMIQTIMAFVIELFVQWKDDGNAINGIVELLPQLLQHVIAVEQDQQNILKILNYTHGLLSVDSDKRRFGTPVYVNFLKCLLQIIRLIPSSELPSSNSNTTPISEIVLNYVDDYSYVVRLEAVKILHFIFQSNEISITLKKNLFRSVKKIIFNSFVIDNRDSVIEKKDEWISRVASALYVFGSVIHTSGVFQTDALNSLLQLHGERGIKITLIMKLLEAVVKDKNDRIKLIEANLYSLINTWMVKQYPSEQFPWMLTQVKTEEDFYRKYIGTLTIIKLEDQELLSLINICESLGISFDNMIVKNFPSIITWLLAQQCNNTNIQLQKYAHNVFSALRDNQAEFKNIKKMSILLEEQLSDILINLIQKLHDKDDFFEMFGIFASLPHVNLPNWDHKTIEKSLERLETLLPIKNKSFFHYLTQKYPNVIQQVLMSLSNNIYKFDIVEYKLKAFHQYAYFSNYITKEISEKFYNEMATFVTTDITYTLMHLIKQGIDPLSNIAGKYFLQFLRELIPSRTNQVCDNLNFIVSNLISAIQSNKINSIGMEILQFLIIDSTEILKESICKLNEFPKNPIFNEITSIYNSLKHTSNQFSLADEILHFLNSENEKIVTCSFEGLLHLKCELSMKKEELNKMYKNLETLRGYAEDCKSSILHRLIYRLVKLTENPDINICLKAAQCLGELGATDLTTMILLPQQDHIIESGNPVEILTYHTIGKLVEFLFENNVNLRETSAVALYKFCPSQWGQNVLTEEYLSTRIQRENMNLRKYTRPFAAERRTVRENVKLLLNVKNCEKYINPNCDLWKGDGGDSYTNWITNLTCTMLNCFENDSFNTLIPVCKVNIEFSETIIAKLVYLMITIDSTLHNNICHCLNHFFAEYFSSSNNMEQSVLLNASRHVDHFSHESVRCMLNIVNFIRIQMENNFQVDLNYLYIAKAAQYCSAYFTSVLYIELGCEMLKKKLTAKPDNITLIDYIYETHPNEGKLLENILRDAFCQIGDPDSIHGCGLSHLKDPSSRIQHYIHLQQWDKVLISQDAELSFGYTFSNDMANALRHTGLDYLLNRFISNNSKCADNMNEYRYESAWRLNDWSILSHDQQATITSESITNEDYYFFHYQALKCLYANDNVAIEDSINNARLSIIKSLRSTSLECSQTLYPKLVKLQMLRELEQLSTMEPDNWSTIISHWSMKNSLNPNDFMYIEPILSQRIVMCNIKYLSTGNLLMRDTLLDTYLELSEIAETQGYPNIAARAIALLAKQRDVPEEMKNKLQFRDALLTWTRKDHDIARFLLRDLINKHDLDTCLKARALRIYGNWMAEAKAENSMSLIENYYNKSIDLAKPLAHQSYEHRNNLNDTYAALAQYADTQYEQISQFMKTPLFESLEKCAKYCGKSRINSAGSRDDVYRALKNQQKQNTMDVHQYETIQKDEMLYLTLAVEYYMLTLANGDNHNFLIFRLVSLWLNNIDHQELNKLFTKHLSSIAAFKFIPLVPQLAPRLSHLTDNIFKKQIYDLMKICAKKHPHHTLPIILALVNTRKDLEYDKTRKKPSEPSERELGAKTLIAELKRDNSLSPIIREMEITSDAYIMLAYHTFSQDKQHNLIPTSQKILRIQNFQHSIVPTITIDIRPSGEYNNIVSIHKFDQHFDSVGGVHRPKKIVSIGTDGIRRTQLVKGEDDLRQDAVMQQVFGVVNLLLQTSKASKRRKLKIRTYKIIPLSQRSGVIEWCENTQPISTVLIGKNGLHAKYHPNDWDTTHCRNKISEAQGRSAIEREQVYRLCCQHLKPAFQYFFFEKFPSPETWFERRLAYVRSVATNSMVGYILGLGDRHFSNILIDQTTAEVVHIDFGIAFEQGQILPIPETVPFRLTRDVEAPMGVSGVEGVMRKCSEETMTVLRDRREIIITLLQVLLYDPLFSWTLTPAQVWHMQSGGGKNRNDESYRGEEKLNKTAERALLTVEQKLQGTEYGLATSISGQVERLIQQARDPGNLSRLFCGWQPFL